MAHFKKKHYIPTRPLMAINSILIQFASQKFWIKQTMNIASTKMHSYICLSFDKSKYAGREPWSSGYGRRLMI